MKNPTILCLALGLLVGGCASPEKEIKYTPAMGYNANDQKKADIDIANGSHHLMGVAETTAHARHINLGERYVVVTTPVSINRLDDSVLGKADAVNQFGRNARDVIIASIVTKYRVIEPRASGEVTLKPNVGEFTQSRVVKGDVTHPVNLIISGTYTENNSSTQLNLEITDGDEILGTSTIVLPFRTDQM